MEFRSIAFLVTVASTVVLASCSTTPRHFSPTIAGPLSDDTILIVAACRELVDSGITSDFVRDGVGPAATGVVTGYGAGALAFAGAGNTLVGTAAAASTALVAMPVIGIAAGVLYTRHVRSLRERQHMEAMTLCLNEHGIEVSDWERTPSE